jgi:hypothetical protein
MDKYQVLGFLISWWITCLLVNMVFQAGYYVLPTVGYETSTVIWTMLSTLMLIIKLLISGMAIGIGIKDFPILITVIMGVVWWAFLIYFVYLNLPKAVGSGSPEP